MTCAVCGHPIRAGDRSAPTAFGLTCDLCLDSGEACTPREEQNESEDET